MAVGYRLAGSGGFLSGAKIFREAEGRIRNLQTQGYEVPSELLDLYEGVKRIVYPRRLIDIALEGATGPIYTGLPERQLEWLEYARDCGQENGVDVPYKEILPGVLRLGLMQLLDEVQEYKFFGRKDLAKRSLERAQALKRKADESSIQLPENILSQVQETEEMF